MPFPSADLTRVRTYPLQQRSSLVAISNLILPDQPPPPFINPELVEIAQRIVASRRAGHQVILMMGGHVVKCGLAPVVIEMMKRGIITHLASNGSAAIHDFEIALTGNTSEDVASSLEDGSFGMAEETGAWMNTAIQEGILDGLGMGEALGRMISEGELFKYKQHSLLSQAYALHIPYTVHVAIGTDIIHQHPLCDFAAIGKASGQDFKIFIKSIAQMEGGVFCNFGSSVIGPEVFLKSLSIARNLGNPLKNITTANFDLVPLAGNYRHPAAKDDPEYYYRPKKNIVIRPNLQGGQGYHVTGDHRQTIPNLYHLILKQLNGKENFSRAAVVPNKKITDNGPLEKDMLPPAARMVLKSLLETYPDLEPCSNSLEKTYRLLADSFSQGGRLYICGNGGSFADAMHISAELNKAFKKPRPIPASLRDRLQKHTGGKLLADNLHQGLPSITLGMNPSLLSAVDNDSPKGQMYFAQELYVLARPGDVLLGISTSGQSRNIRHAALIARSRGVKIIMLTGPKENPLQQAADVPILSPGKNTADIQGWHIRIYHALCEMLEESFFGGSRQR